MEGLLLFLLVLGLGGINGEKWVSFYKDANHEDLAGKRQVNEDCANIPSWMSDSVHSISTQICAAFFEDSNCERPTLTVQPGQNVVVGEYMSSKRLKYVKACRQRKEGFEVKFYKDRSHKDLVHKTMVDHNECNILPVKGIYSAKYLKADGCLMIYHDPFICEGEAVRFASKTSPSWLFNNPSKPSKKIRNDLTAYFGGSIYSFKACPEEKHEVEPTIKLFDGKAEGTAEPIFVNVAHSECNGLPELATKTATSVWTNQCMIFYDDMDCTGRSIRVDPSERVNLEYYGLYIRSYSKCSEKLGGDLSQVEFFTKSGQIITNLTARDICTCTKLNSKVGRAFSVQNHGSCLELFEDANCSKLQRRLVGGMNYLSEDLTTENKMERDLNSVYFPVKVRDLPEVKSFKRCEISQSCHVFETTLEKILIDESGLNKENIESHSSWVPLMTQAIMNNNISYVFPTEYSALERLPMQIVIELVNSLVKVDKKDFPVEIKGGNEINNYIGNEKIISALRNGYFERSEYGARNIYAVNEEKELMVKKRFEISPCSYFEAKAMGKVARDVEINYEAFVKIDGKIKGGEKLKVDVVKKSIPDGLEFVRELDGETLEAKGKGKILLSFGVETTWRWSEKKLEGCVECPAKDEDGCEELDLDKKGDEIANTNLLSIVK